jgi:type II secretory pathway component PulF
MPLADAIWLTPGALPRDAALAVKVGEDTGDLLGAMRAANPSLLFERTLARPVLWRLAYIVPVLLMFVLFMKIKIEPSFVKIFADFDQPLPYFSQLIFGMPLVSLVFPAFAGDALSLLVVLAFVAATVFLALGVAGILQWRGTWRPWLPVLRPIVNWVDAAPVLRLMALETQRGRPLTALSSAARLHPKAAVRQRLQAIVQDLNGGVAWQKSLYQQRLLSVADVAVLAAAERAGNLPWALEETADSFERRANYRLQALAQVVAPLLLVPVALLAGAMIVAYFLPLTNLIRSLS